MKMKEIKCIICGDKQQVRAKYPATFTEAEINRAVFSARRLPDRIHYQIWECGNCGMVFSSPILPPNTIYRLYRESTCSYNEQVPYITKTYLRLFNSVISHLPANPRVLEIGCGDGFFLKALINAGIGNVWGVEPGKEMVAQASPSLRKRIKVDVFRWGLFKPASFDVICFFHVLDHVIDPSEFVEEVFELLKPGGFALVVVHDVAGLSVKLFGERSPIFDIEHIYLFNKKTLKELFIRHGFADASVSNLANTYPLAYWLRMSGLPQALKEAGQFFLTLFHLSGIPVTFPGGNISLIARRKF